MDRDASWTKQGETGGLPSQKTIKQLNEKATVRLLAIIKSGQGSGVQASELHAAKQLVETTTQKIPR